MLIDDKRFTASTATTIAGCKQVTFRAWRIRLGLFPQAKGRGRTRADVKLSILDICMLRTVVVFTMHGLDAADAVIFSRLVELQLHAILAGKEKDYFVGFYRPDPPAKPKLMMWGQGDGSVAEIVERAGGPVTVENLRSIVRHVIRGLKAMGVTE